MMYQILKESPSETKVYARSILSEHAAKLVLNCIKDTAVARGEKVYYYPTEDRLICGSSTYTLSLE